jgi:D-glycerate 3-kinase
MTASSHAHLGSGFPPWLVEAALEAAVSPLPGPSVFGISGVQGSGKSTLARQMTALAEQRGLRVAVLSLDDFYLPRAERLLLADRVHPLLANRGPPGTHDLPLAMQVMSNQRAGRRLRLPRFDKLADERLPESSWPLIDAAVDVVILEGWMLGVPAQPGSALATPVNALEREEDPDAIWRTWCNDALGTGYQDLWRQIDALWLLQAPSFEIVPAWRWQQEQSMQVASPRRPGMGRPQLERFVQLFERVSRHALAVLPLLAERVVELDEHRQPLRRAGLRRAP